MELQINSINDGVLKSIAINNDDGDKIIKGDEIEIFNSQAQKALDDGLVTEEAFKETMGLYTNEELQAPKDKSNSEQEGFVKKALPWAGGVIGSVAGFVGGTVLQRKIVDLAYKRAGNKGYCHGILLTPGGFGFVPTRFFNGLRGIVAAGCTALAAYGAYKGVQSLVNDK